jgi:hypothetical protein
MDIVIPSEARACPELDEENLLFPAITTAFPSTHPRLTNIQSRGACPEVSFSWQFRLSNAPVLR